MTLQEFKNDFYCKLDYSNNGITLTVKSTAYRKIDDYPVDSVLTNMNIQKTNSWIADSQSPISVIEWDWQKIMDEIKRGHLDYFSQRAQIDDFYPLDKLTHKDISIYYEE